MTESDGKANIIFENISLASHRDARHTEPDRLKKNNNQYFVSNCTMFCIIGLNRSYHLRLASIE